MQKTPVKVYIQHTNGFCRVCRISIKISGRSQINIFGANNKEFLRWFEVVGVKIVNRDGLSNVLCQKCYRTVLKYHKILEQEKDIATFREEYNKTVNWSDSAREKRCANNSPSTADANADTSYHGHIRKKACVGRTSLKSKRKLNITDHTASVIENNPFEDLYPDVLSDPSEHIYSVLKGVALAEVRRNLFLLKS